MKHLKTLIIVIIIILSTIIILKPGASQNKKYDIKINENDSIVLFILTDKLNALYIKENNEISVIILNYNVDDKIIEKILIENNIEKIDKLYNITPVVIELFNIKSTHLNTVDNIINIRINNNNFCIFNEEKNMDVSFKQCKFLYVYKFKNQKLKGLIGNPYVIFQNYNNPLPILTQEQIYDEWTELYTIEKDYYTILKISNSDFDTIVVPIVK